MKTAGTRADKTLIMCECTQTIVYNTRIRGIEYSMVESIGPAQLGLMLMDLLEQSYFARLSANEGVLGPSDV